VVTGGKAYSPDMKTIVECVPNFSEGRNLQVIDNIASAIESVVGLKVLHLDMDTDYHRTVVTFVGEKEQVAEGALRAIGKATELIDLNQHSGAHPRIGASDVVPFVPIRNVTLQDCVDIAYQVGKEAHRRFLIPVYLYGAAAIQPHRSQLENVRQGQFEGLQWAFSGQTSDFPDFGTGRVHPTAGAVAVGARNFLIAYNINLATPDVRLAKKIAQAIRSSSGGLPHIKAIGLNLKTRMQVQVSINLTNFEVSPLQMVFDKVCHEAALIGTRVTGSEIVGLVPRKALPANFESSLQLKDFQTDSVFENRLDEILKELSPTSATNSQ